MRRLHPESLFMGACMIYGKPGAMNPENALKVAISIQEKVDSLFAEEEEKERIVMESPDAKET